MLRLSFLAALPLPVVPFAVVAIVPVVSVITTPTATRCRGARSWDACCRCAGNWCTRSPTDRGLRWVRLPSRCRRFRVDAGAKRPQSRDGPERYARQEQCVHEPRSCAVSSATKRRRKFLVIACKSTRTALTLVSEANRRVQ